MTKKTIIAASLACTAMALPAQDLLRITTNNGDEQDYSLENFDRLTFSDDETSMNVEMKSGETTVVLLSDLRYITFEYTSTAVNDVVAQVQFSVVDRSLVRVTSPEAIRNVAIYDAQGRTLALMNVGGAQQADVKLGDIASGVNIIVVETTRGKVSRKFTIK